MGVGGGGGAEAVDVGQRGAMWGWDALSQGGAQELHAVPPSTAPPQPAALRFLTFGVLYQGGGLAPFPTQQHSPPPTAAAPNAFAVDRGAQTHTRTHTQGSAPRPPRPSRCPPRHQTPPFLPQPHRRLLKTQTKPPPPPPSSHPRPPFLCFVLLGNVHPFGSAPSTTTPTRSAHGWKRCSRWSPVTPRRGAVPAGPAWPCPGGTHGSWGGYRMVQGFLSLKGFSEAGTPTSSGSLRACCSQ